MVEFVQAPAGRVDPHVKLPSSVANASAAIDAFYARQAKQPVAPPPVAPPEPPKAPEPPPEPPKAAEPPSPQPDSPPVQPPPQPDLPPVDEPAPTNEQIQQDVWANRYNAMRGRLGAETKKFNQERAEKDRQIMDLHHKLSQLSDEVVKTNQLMTRIHERPPAPPEPPKTLITPEDLERHGADTVDFVQRAAREALQSEIDRVAEENSQVKQELSRSRKAIMNQELTREVPNWREVNKDPRFLAWLRKPNIYSGRSNQELLNEASRSADAQRVAAFFKGFLSEEKVTGQRPDPAATSPLPTAPRTPVVDLASLASPGSGKPASGTDVYTPPSKPTYKTSDFERFRRAKAKGQYTEAQVIAIEADMHRATLEGRIIKG